MALIGLTSNAQELGLVSRAAENPKFEKSNYVEFLMNASQYTRVETVLIGTIKLPSIATMGGYTVTLERTTDLTTNQSKKAVLIAPIGGAVSAVTGLFKKGTTDNPSMYYIDDTEVDAFLTHLKKCKRSRKQRLL